VISFAYHDKFPDGLWHQQNVEFIWNNSGANADRLKRLFADRKL
jgi:hypothetical protein